MKKTIKTTAVFFDTEFTHLDEHSGLISIGCLTESGKFFYAENDSPDEALYSDFVKNNVITMLEGGYDRMPYSEIASRLKSWVESINGNVVFLSDAPIFDWPHVQDLFNQHGWPKNLSQNGVDELGLNMFQMMLFRQKVEKIFKENISMRRHHAGDDVRVNLMAYTEVQHTKHTFFNALINIFFGE